MPKRVQSKIVRPLRNGQITIPAEFRRRLGIDEDSVLRMTLEDGELRLTPLHAVQTIGGSRWLSDLYDLLAPVRDEGMQYEEEEIDRAIDAAVKAVREAHA